MKRRWLILFATSFLILFIRNTSAHAYTDSPCDAQLRCEDGTIVSGSAVSDFGPTCYQVLSVQLANQCASHGGSNVYSLDWWTLYSQTALVASNDQAVLDFIDPYPDFQPDSSTVVPLAELPESTGIVSY